MTFTWIRLPLAEGAPTATADTTETQIGTGYTVPTWAKSVKWVSYELIYAALTTQEDCAGYLRIKDDANQIEPFYLPLPVAGSLATAAGTHFAKGISMPVELPLTAEDTLRAYVNLDSATTGVPEIACYMLITDQSPKYREHSVMSTLQTASTTQATAAAGGTLTTLARKCKNLHAIGGYVSIGAGDTAAQTQGGYIKISSQIPGWVDQRIKTNYIPSGLGTDVDGVTKPFLCCGVDKLPYVEGFYKSLWPGFPVQGRNDFTIVSYMDDTNTVAPTYRVFLYFHE